MKKQIGKQLVAMVFSLIYLLPTVGWAMDVFVTVPPQKWIVDRIAGELATVHVLVKNGQDPHTFEPTPKQIVALSRAEAWFTMGMPFEERLKIKVGRVAPDLNIVDMSEGVERITFHDDHGHDHDHHKGIDDADPHVWLSPANLQKLAANTAGVLSRLDTSSAAFYHRNLQEVATDLTKLDARISLQLAPYAGSSFYVFHPSFGYFAREYGLHQEAVEVGGKSPGPRQIGALVARAKKEQVKVIFVQPQFDQKSAETVAAAIRGQVVALDALAEDVVTNLTVMADKIEQALGQREIP